MNNNVQKRRHLTLSLPTDRNTASPASSHFRQPHPERELGPRCERRHGDGVEQVTIVFNNK